PDQRHHHATRAARESRVRQTLVRDRGQNQRRADERPEHPTPQPKPRVELFDLSSRQLKELNGKLYFAAIPKGPTTAHQGWSTFHWCRTWHPHDHKALQSPPVFRRGWEHLPAACAPAGLVFLRRQRRR